MDWIWVTMTSFFVLAGVGVDRHEASEPNAHRLQPLQWIDRSPAHVERRVHGGRISLKLPSPRSLSLASHTISWHRTPSHTISHHTPQPLPRRVSISALALSCTSGHLAPSIRCLSVALQVPFPDASRRPRSRPLHLRVNVTELGFRIFDADKRQKEMLFYAHVQPWTKAPHALLHAATRHVMRLHTQLLTAGSALVVARLGLGRAGGASVVARKYCQPGRCESAFSHGRSFLLARVSP